MGIVVKTLESMESITLLGFSNCLLHAVSFCFEVFIFKTIVECSGDFIGVVELVMVLDVLLVLKWYGGVMSSYNITNTITHRFPMQDNTEGILLH